VATGKLAAGMVAVTTVSLAAMLVCAGSALAQDASGYTSPAYQLPLLAQNPQATKNTASPWKGLYFGSEVFAISRKGSKGGIGGSGYIGYKRDFDNNVFLAVQANAGYMPSLFRHRAGPSGLDYVSASLKAGYDFGRVRPYVTAGFGVAAPTMFGGNSLSPVSDSINSVFSAPGRTTFTTIGAGVDYKVTENITLGVAVSVRNVQTKNDLHRRYGAYGPYGPFVPVTSVP
jgi:opacity protein-like surface antigen